MLRARESRVRDKVDTIDVWRERKNLEGEKVVYVKYKQEQSCQHRLSGRAYILQARHIMGESLTVSGSEFRRKSGSKTLKVIKSTHHSDDSDSEASMSKSCSSLS